jgi:hypothetical protein
MVQPGTTRHREEESAATLSLGPGARGALRERGTHTQRGREGENALAHVWRCRTRSTLLVQPSEIESLCVCPFIHVCVPAWYFPDVSRTDTEFQAAEALLYADVQFQLQKAQAEKAALALEEEPTVQAYAAPLAPTRCMCSPAWRVCAEAEVWVGVRCRACTVLTATSMAAHTHSPCL